MDVTKGTLAITSLYVLAWRTVWLLDRHGEVLREFR
jgi:hypothetical protein